MTESFLFMSIAPIISSSALVVFDRTNRGLCCPLCITVMGPLQ